MRSEKSGGLRKQNPAGVIILLIITAVFLLLSCGKQEKQKAAVPEAQKTGIYKIALSPPDAKRGSDITASVRGADSQDLSFKWTVNGMVIEGAKGSILKYPGLKRETMFRL